MTDIEGSALKLPGFIRVYTVLFSDLTLTVSG